MCKLRCEQGPVLALFFVVSTVPLAYALDWRSCSSGSLAQVNEVQLHPEPKAGQGFVIDLQAICGQSISNATLDVSVAYLGITVATKHGSLCQAVVCPVAAGPLTISLPAAMPSLAPHGTYAMTVSSATAQVAGTAGVQGANANDSAQPSDSMTWPAVEHASAYVALPDGSSQNPGVEDVVFCVLIHFRLGSVVEQEQGNTRE